MRVLFLARSLFRGGAERQLVAAANGLAERGHEVAVALFYSGGALEKDLKGVEVVPLRKVGRWDVVGFVGRLVRAVRSFRPDAVYSYLGTANVLSASLQGFWKGARVVWALRASDMDLSHYGYLSRFNYWLEARMSFLADIIITNSNAGLRHAVGKGMNGETCRVIFNGIDTDIYRPDRQEGVALRDAWCGPDQILVGIVGRLDPMKDHRTFLRAARLVVEADLSVRFVCIGGGETAWTKELHALSEDLGLLDSLTWAGELDYMNAAYNALDICCLSSITEGFPNVVAEAMSCDVPCVVTNAGDAGTIVGDTGLVVPRKDPERLAAALLQMIGMVRSGKVAGVRQRIVGHFSLDAMILQTERALEA